MKIVLSENEPKIRMRATRREFWGSAQNHDKMIGKPNELIETKFS
jgi:hypothetical protein